MKQLKVLMVCLGNICRSPMAHGLLQHKVKQLGLPWIVDSAGTSDWHRGSQPDSRAVDCMKRHHIDITEQRSRPFIKNDFKEFDLIYVMDRANLEDVLMLTTNEDDQQKVALIMSTVYEQRLIDVPDPYYGVGEKGFENVFDMLDEATDAIIERYAMSKLVNE
jgi:protein-tyrosine phosphatase